MVSDQQRMLFIDLVQNKQMLIREAAEITNIGYENAKVINRVFKQDGRNIRLTSKNRKTPKRSIKQD
jgi:transposase